MVITNFNKHSIENCFDCNYELEDRLKEAGKLDEYEMIHMITFFCDDENVAYYGNSMKIVKMIIMFVTSIGGVLLPRLSYLIKEKQYEKCTYVVNIVLNVLFFFFFPCCLGLFLVAEDLVVVMFGTSFNAAVVTLKISTMLIFTLGFSNLFGTQVLLSFGGEKNLLISTLMGAFSNICMNMVRIPRYQQNGAAVASVISEAIVTLMTYLYSRKYVKYKITKDVLVPMIVSTVFMFGMLIFVNSIITNNNVRLIVGVVGAVIIYFCGNIILKNPLLKILLGTIKKEKVVD